MTAQISFSFVEAVNFFLLLELICLTVMFIFEVREFNEHFKKYYGGKKP